MSDRDEMRRWNAALSVKELDPTDPAHKSYYVHLADQGTTAIDEIAASIELSLETRTVHLLSGPRGSGKSSELLRLRHHLETRGHTVVYLDVLDYVSESQPLDIEILLTVIGLGVSAALDPDAGSATFADRLRNWLSGWRPESVDVKVGVDAGAASAGLSTKFTRVEQLGTELKGNPAFVAWLHDQLNFFLRELKEKIDELIAGLAVEHADGRPIVLILDSLEKVGTTARGSMPAEQTARLFVDHPQRLTFPQVHAIYTVPPVAPVLYPGFAAGLGDGVLHQIPIPRIDASPDGDGVDPDLFIDAVQRRVAPTALTDILEPPDIDRIVEASGGHLDDLFNLMRRVLTVALARGHDFPVPADVVNAALADLRATFTPGTAEQEATIRWVVDNGHDHFPPEEMVATLAHLLAVHMILHRRNDHDWYEAHPLTIEAIGTG